MKSLYVREWLTITRETKFACSPFLYMACGKHLVNQPVPPDIDAHGLGIGAFIFNPGCERRRFRIPTCPIMKIVPPAEETSCNLVGGAADRINSRFRSLESGRLPALNIPYCWP